MPSPKLGVGHEGRQFFSVLGGAAAWPVMERAQQFPIPVIGHLGSSSFEPAAGALSAEYVCNIEQHKSSHSHILNS